MGCGKRVHNAMGGVVNAEVTRGSTRHWLPSSFAFSPPSLPYLTTTLAPQCCKMLPAVRYHHRPRRSQQSPLE